MQVFRELCLFMQDYINIKQTGYFSCLCIQIRFPFEQTVISCGREKWNHSLDLWYEQLPLV